MKNVIIWAGNHKLLAQFLLTTLLLIIGLGGILLGISASLDGFNLGIFPFSVALTSAFLMILILYPSNKELRKIGVSRNYIQKWKMYDFALVLILAGSTFFLGNQSAQHDLHERSTLHLMGSLLDAPTTMQVGNYSSNRPSLKNRFLKKIESVQQGLIQFVQTVKEKSDSGRRALNALLFVLMYIGYLIIIFYAALFSCSLACNGMGAAAAIVLIGTQVLLLVGIFFGARALLKQRKKWSKREWTKSELNWKIALATLGAALSPLLFFVLGAF